MKQWKKSIISAFAASVLMTTPVFAAAGDIVLLDLSSYRPVIDTSIPGFGVEWQSSSNGFEANAGEIFFKNTVKDGSLFWDFENDSEIGVLSETTSDISASNYECSYEEGQWVNGTVHSTEKERSKPEFSASNEPSGDVPLPGNRCMKITTPAGANVRRYATRVKIHKDDIKAGESYTLNFSFAISDNNPYERALWIDFRPYDTKDHVLFSSADAWYAKEKSGVVEDYTQKVENGWHDYSVDIVPEKSDFNDDGYTTLYFVYQSADPLAYGSWDFVNAREIIYFDNISLIPSGGSVTSEFAFNCSVSGNAGQSITAEAVVDGERTIFTVAGVCGEDGKAVLTKEFTLTDNDPIVSGDDRLTTSEESDGRIKIKIYSDEAPINLDNASMTKKTDSMDSRPIAVSYEIYSENDAEVSVTDEETGSTLYTFNVTQGRGKYTKLLTNSDTGGEIFSLFNESNEQIGGKPFSLIRFFRNGAELDYTSPELMSLMGAGRYVMEFEVSENITDSRITLNYCGIPSSVKLNGAGTYAVEFEIPAEKLSEAGSVQVTEEIGITNITLKKTLDR